jgi:hypothetical protein
MSHMTATAKCPVCGDTGWVCEAHPDLLWGFFSDRADACQCGDAGMPCTACNPSDHEHPPDMSRTGLIVEEAMRQTRNPTSADLGSRSAHAAVIEGQMCDRIGRHTQSFDRQ